MARHMPTGNTQQSICDETSSQSSHISSQYNKKGTFGSSLPQTPSKINALDIRTSLAPTHFNDPEALELDDQDVANINNSANDFTFDDNDEALLNFTEIPVMSNDGAYDSGTLAPANKNNELKEDEHEDMILDRGNEYKMVSIMRQKGRAMVSNPYEDASKLTQIEEEEGGQQQKKWTNALPRFGKEEDMEEVKKVPEDSGMSFEETADIKVSNNDRKMREKLMSRLVQNNILESSRPKTKSYQTVIIWDWDDTLMASTFLSPYQSRILEPSVRKRLPKPAQQQLD